MIIVTGIIEITEADIDAARVAVAAMVAETLKEDGCHIYEFSQVVGQEHRFRVYEEWADLASLEAHFVSGHMARFREALSQINVISRAISRFEAGPRAEI